jgi:hypothetical protein
MTSYREPDYDVALNISLETFQSLAGTAFSAQFIFDCEQRDIPGMLIIPQYKSEPSDAKMVSQIQGFSRNPAPVKAWIWLEDYLYIQKGKKLNVTLGKPCDPMCSPLANLEKYTALASYSGLNIEGVVTRNWGLKS